MHACHANASCHIGVARTLSTGERFCWWISMDICTQWWLRRCLQCEARTSSRQTLRCPILSLLLPSGPGVAVGVDYFGPLPITPQGNSCTLLFTGRFCRRAHIYAVSTAEFTDEGTAESLFNQYIPLSGCPASAPKMDINFAPICRLPCTSSSTSEQSRRAPTVLTATVPYSA